MPASMNTASSVRAEGSPVVSVATDHLSEQTLGLDETRREVNRIGATEKSPLDISTGSTPTLPGTPAMACRTVSPRIEVDVQSDSTSRSAFKFSHDTILDDVVWSG